MNCRFNPLIAQTTLLNLAFRYSSPHESLRSHLAGFIDTLFNTSKILTPAFVHCNNFIAVHKSWFFRLVFLSPHEAPWKTGA